MNQFISNIGTQNAIILVVMSLLGAAMLLYQAYPARNYIVPKED
jgi:hypothetical protein